MSSSEAVAGTESEFGPVETPPGVRALLERLRRAAADAPTADGAVYLLEVVAREMVATLGRFDRETLGAWCELARHRDSAGDPAGAVRLLEQLLPDLTQALGADDPDTLLARLELAACIGNSGRPDIALHQIHELLPALTAAAGPNDIRVLRARRDLALQTARAGDLGGCVYQLQQLIPQIQQVLGEQDALLAEARLDLATHSQQWGRTPPGGQAGIGWGELVAIVYRLTVWDFDSDKDAEICLSELERRTGRRDLSDRIFTVPEHLTADQVAALVFGQPGPAAPPPWPTA